MWRKFDHDSYKVSGGLHGVGVSVVNALSEKLKLEINREGKKFFIEFIDGKAKAPLKVIGKSKSNGTEINFLPSKEIFSTTKFSANIIQKRMRELAFLNKGNFKWLASIDIFKIYEYPFSMPEKKAVTYLNKSSPPHHNSFHSRRLWDGLVIFRVGNRCIVSCFKWKK